MHSEEYAQRVYDQVDHDNQESGNGFTSCSVALFGEPDKTGDAEKGKFEFVFTGRHVTRRCDGNSVEGAAFGGPIFYGHAAERFNEKADHPGNVYWYQANAGQRGLQGARRQAARGRAARADPRKEQAAKTVALSGKKEGLSGLRIGEMTHDQRDLVRKVLADLLAPFRKADADEAMKLIEAGGFDDLHMAFYNGKAWTSAATASGTSGRSKAPTCSGTSAAHRTSTRGSTSASRGRRRAQLISTMRERTARQAEKAARTKVLQAISSAFDSVTIGTGLTLHQARALDNYCHAWEVEAAKEQDTETRWQDVSDEKLLKLHDAHFFLDAAGFRFYLPAFMIWSLEGARRHGHSAFDQTVTMLQPPNERFASLEHAQACAVCAVFEIHGRARRQIRLASGARRASIAGGDSSAKRCGDCVVLRQVLEERWSRIRGPTTNMAISAAKLAGG